MKLISINIDFQPRSYQIVKITTHTWHKYFHICQQLEIFLLVLIQNTVYIRLYTSRQFGLRGFSQLKIQAR